jgi:hypothetical protein
VSTFTFTLVCTCHLQHMQVLESLQGVVELGCVQDLNLAKIPDVSRQALGPAVSKVLEVVK